MRWVVQMRAGAGLCGHGNIIGWQMVDKSTTYIWRTFQHLCEAPGKQDLMEMIIPWTPSKWGLRLRLRSDGLVETSRMCSWGRVTTVVVLTTRCMFWLVFGGFSNGSWMKRSSGDVYLSTSQLMLPWPQIPAVRIERLRLYVTPQKKVNRLLPVLEKSFEDNKQKCCKQPRVT